jgi:phosphoribosyl-AMP cyclohydrolase / phosphoribosyl-ATP pyrophosphohydrolase
MIIPSVDIMGGKVVQLEKGSKKILEETDIEARLKDFSRYGEVAMIDLDAAMGQGDNSEIVEYWLKRYPVRVGGGIRTVERAKRLYQLGARHVILGSAAYSGNKPNLDFIRELEAEIGREPILVSLDTIGGKIAVKGWKETIDASAVEVAREFAPHVGGFLVTAVDREGLLGGTDRPALDAIRDSLKKDFDHIRIVAAGGIKSVEEISALSQGGYDMQLGMSIYKGIVPVSEAFIASIDFSKGLVPTVTRDTSGQVVMVANSTAESLRKTFETGLVTYWSRSRNELWTKGLTSGNTQPFVSVRTDCDCDSILFTAEPAGPACHTEAWSCFGEREYSLQELYDVIKDRFDRPVAGSYTATLDADRIRRKINEESFELVTAKTREEIIWEAADLLYFTTAFLAKNEIGLDEIMNELRKRRKK